MANTMFRRTAGTKRDLQSQINQFASNVRRSGKTPEQLLDELIKSGKYTTQQIQKAKELAMFFSQGGKL